MHAGPTRRTCLPSFPSWCWAHQEMYNNDESNSDAYMYSEEDWTERLANSLNLHPVFADESLTYLRSFRFGHKSDLDEFRQTLWGFTPYCHKICSMDCPIYLINEHPQFLKCAITPADEAHKFLRMMDPQLLQLTPAVQTVTQP